MAAKDDDFYVSFGSNAKAFTTKTISELEPLKREIQTFAGLLNSLEEHAGRTGGGLRTALAGLAAREPTPATTTGGSAASLDTSHIQAQMETVANDLKSVVKILHETTDAFRKTKNAQAAALDKLSNGKGNWHDPNTGDLVKTADVMAGKHPGAYQMSASTGIKLEGTLSKLAAQASANSSANLSTPAKVTLSGLNKVQLDQGGFDRVVKAINDLHETVKRNQTGGGTRAARPAAADSADEEVVATPAGKKGRKKTAALKSPTVVETVPLSNEERIDVLRGQLAELAVGNQKIAALMKAAGHINSDQLKTLIDQNKATESTLRQELAGLERETTGITRTQQKAARKEKAKSNRGPDLYGDEYDRRKDILDKINLAASPEQFIEKAKTRGQNGFTAAELKDVAKELNNLGFEVKTSDKPSKGVLAERIVSARGAYGERYGADIPEELMTGRRLTKTTMTDNARNLLGRSNQSAADMAEEQQHRENIRLAYLAQHLPKDPTHEVTHSLPRSALLDVEDLPSHGFAMSEELQRGLNRMNVAHGTRAGDLSEMWTSGGSAVRVPRGMVKGGNYNDVFGLEEAQAFLQQKRLGMAAVHAQSDPSFNPFEVDPNKDVKGHDDEAAMARQRIRELRRGTAELDNLGNAYKINAEAIDLINDAIEKATRRIQRADAGKKLSNADRAKLADDPEHLQRLNERLTDLHGQQNAIHNAGLQDVFEDPEYQQGLKARNMTRARQQAAREAAREEAEYAPDAERAQAILNRTNVHDAMGSALFGSRLAIGTPDTYISPIPGARYNPGKDRIDFGRGREEENPAQLTELNAAFKAMRGSLKKEARLLRDITEEGGLEAASQDLVEAWHKAKTKSENQAVKFGNQVNKVFGEGLAPDVESMLGRPMESEKNIATDQRRRDARDQVQTAITAKPEGESATAAQTLAQRIQEYDKVLAEQMAASAKVKEASEALAATERTAVEALTTEEKAALEVARADEERTRRTVAEGTDRRQRERAQAENFARVQRNEAAAAERALKEADQGPRPYTLAQHTDIEGLRGAHEAALAGASHAATSLEDLKATHLTESRAESEAWRAAQARAATVLNADSEEVNKQRETLNRLRQEEDRLRIATRKQIDGVTTVEVTRGEGGTTTKDRTVGGLRPLVLGQAEDRLSARHAKVTELERVGGSDADIAEATQAVKEARTHLAALQKMNDPELIDHLREQADFTPVATPVAKGEKGKKAAAQQQADATLNAADAAELKDLQATYDAGTAERKKRTVLRAQLKQAKAKKDKEEIADLQTQLKDLREAQPGGAHQTNDERKALRARMDLLRTGGGAGGSGGGGGFGGRGGGGFSEESNNILRQILAAINGVHRTLQTGVKTTGGTAATKVDAEGNPVPSKPRAAGSRTKASSEELAQARSDDEDQKALAAAAQRRRLEAAKQAGGDYIGNAQTAAVLKDEQFNKKRDQQNRKNAEAARVDAHAQLQLAQALGLVDQKALQELAALRQMSLAGAESTKIAQQQARAYNAIQVALARQGADGNMRRQMAGTLLNDANVRRGANGEEVQGPKIGATGLSAIAQSGNILSGFKSIDEQLGAANDPEKSAFGRSISNLFGPKGFWSRAVNSTGTFLVRNFTAGFVFGLTNALQDVMSQALKTETTFIRVSNALEQTGESTKGLRAGLQGISTEMGASLNDVYDTASKLVGLYDNVTDLKNATRVSTQLQIISDGALNANEAVGILASTVGGFGQDINVNHVADVLTSVQNTTGQNVEVTAEAVGRMSGLAKELNISYEATAVYGAQIAKLTNQTGGAAGEQFSRILSSLQTGRGRSAVTKAFGKVDGKDTGISADLNAGNYGKVLATMTGNWDKLSDAQKRNVATTVAGQRQASAFAALMNNGTSTLNAITKATYSAGQADERIAKLMDTLGKRLRVLQVNFQNLADQLVRSGTLTFLGVMLGTTDKVVTGINNFLGLLNGFADSNPFLGFLRHAIGGLAGMAATVWLLRKSIAGLKATLAETAVGRGMANLRAEKEATAVAAAEAEGQSVVTTRSGRVRGPGLFGVAPTPAFRDFGDPAARAGRPGGFINTPNGPSLQPAVKGTVGAPLTRGIGYGLDRLVGQPVEILGAGFSKLGGAIRNSQSAMENESRIRNVLARAVAATGATVQGTGAVVGGVARGARSLFQGHAGPDAMLLSERLQARADLYRARADTMHAFSAADQDPNRSSWFSRLRRSTPVAPVAPIVEPVGKGLLDRNVPVRSNLPINPNMMYRMIGGKGYDDFKDTGVVRARSRFEEGGLYKAPYYGDTPLSRYDRGRVGGHQYVSEVPRSAMEDSGNGYFVPRGGASNVPKANTNIWRINEAGEAELVHTGRNLAEGLRGQLSRAFTSVTGSLSAVSSTFVPDRLRQQASRALGQVTRATGAVTQGAVRTAGALSADALRQRAEQARVAADDARQAARTRAADMRTRAAALREASRAPGTRGPMSAQSPLYGDLNRPDRLGQLRAQLTQASARFQAPSAVPSQVRSQMLRAVSSVTDGVSGVASSARASMMSAVTKVTTSVGSAASKVPMLGRTLTGGPSLSLQERGYRLAATGASAASRAMSGLGSTLTGLASSGMMANVGVMVLIGAVTAYFSAQAKEARLLQDVRNQVKGRYGDIDKNGNKVKTEKPYLGPSSDAYDQFTDETKGKSNFGMGASVVGNALKDGVTGLFDGLHSWGKIGNETGRTLGIESDGKGGNRTYGMGRAESMVSAASSQLESVSGSSDALTEAQRKIRGKFKAEAEKIVANKDTSSRQKEAALAMLDQAQAKIEDQVAALIAQSNGVNAATRLTSDQVAHVQTLVETAGLTGGDATNFNGVDVSGIVGQQLKDTGVDLKSPLGQKLKKVATGGGDAADVAVANEGLLRTELKNMQANWLSKLNQGDTEGAASDWQAIQSIMTQLDTAGVNSIQKIIEHAQTLATEAAAKGDYKEAARLYGQAAGRLNARDNDNAYNPDNGGLPSPVLPDPIGAKGPFGQFAPTRKKLSPIKQAQEDAAKRAGLAAATQNLEDQASAPLDEAMAKTRSSATRNKLANQKAQAVLNALRDARRRYGPMAVTAQQIAQAENDVFTSATTVADDMRAQKVANLALTAARHWGETQGAQDQIDAADLAIKQARKNGDKAGITAGKTQKVQAQHAKDQLEEQQRTAAAQAQIARIPQKDTGAIHRATLRDLRKQLAFARRFGKDSTQYQGILQQIYAEQQAGAQAAREAGDSVATARANLAQAIAEAHGDARGAARAQVHAAQIALRQARATGTKADIINAQAALVQANAAYSASIQDFIQSRLQVGIALADAAGNTVLSAQRQLHAARVALAAAKRKAGGRNTAEVNAAKATEIQARAGARDAVLQDRLDTIDFNLSMNRITQSGAIAALQHILKTADLTKRQRRDLLLKIKGMKDEIANDQWNFADIKMPTPYEMKRYIVQERKARQAALGHLAGDVSAAKTAQREAQGGAFGSSAPTSTSVSHSTTNQTTIQINGADVAKVRKVVEEIVGRSTKVRTTQARRR